MNAIQRKRLRAPVLTAACGLILAVAVLLAAGWAAALPVAAITALAAGACYWLGGTETDFGALIAARVDEAVGCTPLGAGVRSRRAVRDGDDRGGRFGRCFVRTSSAATRSHPSSDGRA